MRRGKYYETQMEKNIKVRKSLIQDLENLSKITSTTKLSEIHEFYLQQIFTKSTQFKNHKVRTC